MVEHLYTRPQLYDIAFSWNLAPEIDFFERLFERHVAVPVPRILEPACGTGRLLRAFAGRAYECVGYDMSRPMLEYARKSMNDDLGQRVWLVRAAMETASFKPVFQVAVNSINSMGYLLSDRDILKHLRGTASALARGGIYVVHLGIAPERCDPEDETNHWTHEREGLMLETHWREVEQDRAQLLSRQRCTMRVTRQGKVETLEDDHLLRLWLYDDWRRLIERSGVFALDAVYDPQFKEVQAGTRITAEQGNVYYVLKRV
jgi:SAM-dependent methyltransferase